MNGLRICGTLMLALICSGCGNAASTAKTSRQHAPPSPQEKPVRNVPVLETVDAEEDTAAEDLVVEPSVVPPAFRPPDRRPQHDDEQLAAAGIHRYESKRLLLYTDIDPDIAQTLPPIVDQLYDALANYFGPLLPDEQGTEFQMTGYLIRDETLFRELRLLEGLPTLLHGKHLANRFWLREQQYNYFRRHLLLHECVHCYMTYVPGVVPPVWYMEGMAELFATHRLNSDGTAKFGILPHQQDDVSGWGRIATIRTLCAEQKTLSIRGVYDLPHESFFQPPAYAWSWGLCCFLDGHPRYRDRFRKLGQHLTDGQFGRVFHEQFADDERDLTTEWTLFQHQVQPGYDIARAAIEFQALTALPVGEQKEVTVRADRGWQDAGLPIESGQTYELTATGRFTLANDPKPWVSEPQGISIDYFNGVPLGRLMTCLDVDSAGNPSGPAAISVGKSSTVTVSAHGRMLLRLNDAWDSLADNAGEIRVSIRRID